MTMWYGDDEEVLGVISASEPETAPRLDEAPDISGAQPFTDSSGAVTVWSDNDLRIVRVRISNRWRERTRKSSLEGALMEAFRSRQFDFPVGGPERGIAVEDGEPFDPIRILQPDYFDAGQHNRLLSDTWDMLDRLAATPAEAFAPTTVFEPAIGRSRNREVSCTLDAQMLVEQVTLNASWLRDVRIEPLVASVEEALRDAYAGWRAPEHRYAEQVAALRADLDELTERNFKMMGLTLRREGGAA